MRRLVTLCVLLLAVQVSARGKDLTVNLKFAPQEGVHSESPDLGAPMLDRPFVLRIEDARAASDAMRIGKGSDDDDEVFSIAAGSNVVTFLGDALKTLTSEWGLKSAESADRVLTVKVARFFVEESNKAVGSMYASEVKLTWTLADAKGKTLAEGSGSGSAHRYGRARSGDNCSEVLSDALKEAYTDVLSRHELQTAWASGKAASGAASASSEASKGSVEERLRKLDELLKKGLITKEEYATKRAEILKDV